jgi:mono/diheme cytochrome c family protein
MKRLPTIGAGVWVALAISFSFGQGEKVEGDVKAGATIFQAKCADCHEAYSKEAKTGPGLKGVKDGKLPSGAPATQETILKLIEDGREEMPPFADILSSQQKKDVSAYVLTL